MIKEVECLIQKAGDAENAYEAGLYAQAAMNIATTIATIEQLELTPHHEVLVKKLANKIGGAERSYDALKYSQTLMSVASTIATIDLLK